MTFTEIIKNKANKTLLQTYITFMLALSTSFIHALNIKYVATILESYLNTAVKDG